jgi:FPC/CPF motif-containing protein YcgG
MVAAMVSSRVYRANDEAHPLAERFRHFVRNQAFPCVGAKSAVGRDQMRIVVARDINSAWDDLRIYSALFDFSQDYGHDSRLFQSFAVIFESPHDMTEVAFERALWSRVQSLADKDAWHGQRYDERVSADPANPHFSLSFGGQAFFVVGLHPGASRPARRFERPALVFNLHDQFERLREADRYEQLRETILARDLAVAGSLNPMLARHGEASEARQYSGRRVGEAWECPFVAKAAPASAPADA